MTTSRVFPRLLLATGGCLLLAVTAAAKVDLVTLPDRDRVQLTIYNSADLTLVRDQRTLRCAKAPTGCSSPGPTP